MIIIGYEHVHSTHIPSPICHKSLCLGCYWLPFLTSLPLYRQTVCSTAVSVFVARCLWLPAVLPFGHGDGVSWHLVADRQAHLKEMQNLLITRGTWSKNMTTVWGIIKHGVCLTHLHDANTCILRSQDTIHTTVSWAPLFCLHIPMKEILGAQGWDHHWTLHWLWKCLCSNYYEKYI